MELLKMSSHQCLLYSAAMLLGVTPEELVEEFGHDGLDRVWDLPEPACYRGHHIQEIVDAAFRRGHALVPVDAFPMSAHPGVQPVAMMSESQAIRRLSTYLLNRHALLIGDNHACAWDGKRVYDPNGYVRDLESFPVRQAWILI